MVLISPRLHKLMPKGSKVKRFDDAMVQKA
jgi:hypothetical protein